MCHKHLSLSSCCCSGASTHCGSQAVNEGRARWGPPPRPTSVHSHCRNHRERNSQSSPPSPPDVAVITSSPVKKWLSQVPMCSALINKRLSLHSLGSSSPSHQVRPVTYFRACEAIQRLLDDLGSDTCSLLDSCESLPPSGTQFPHLSNGDTSPVSRKWKTSGKCVPGSLYYKIQSSMFIIASTSYPSTGNRPMALNIRMAK